MAYKEFGFLQEKPVHFHKRFNPQMQANHNPQTHTMPPLLDITWGNRKVMKRKCNVNHGRAIVGNQHGHRGVLGKDALTHPTNTKVQNFLQFVTKKISTISINGRTYYQT